MDEDEKILKDIWKKSKEHGITRKDVEKEISDYRKERARLNEDFSKF